MKKQHSAVVTNIIEVTQAKSNLYLLVQVVIRVGLFCLAAAGTNLMVTEVYQLSIDTADVVIFSIVMTIVFNLLFFLLKFRYALPLVAIVGFFYARHVDLLEKMNHLVNFLLHSLDNRIIYTSAYATMPKSSIREQHIITAAFFIFALICLIYAVAARAKFVGVVLLVTIILLLPAFVAERAEIGTGLYLLMISSLGIYSTWLAHESGSKPRYPATKKHTIMGGVPYVNSHSFAGLMTAGIATVIVLIISRLPMETLGNANDYIHDLQDRIISGVSDIGGSLQYYTSNIQHSGYFPNHNEIGQSDYIHLNSPTDSTRPALQVTLEDPTSPLPLRGSIGVNYSSAANGWTSNSNAREINQLEKLMEGFYPEIEYMLYTQRVRSFADYTNYVGLQNVTVEYLMGTNVMLMPPSIYLPSYKSNENLTHTLDTVLRSDRSMRSDSFATFYPKQRDNFGNMLQNVTWEIQDERADGTNLITAYTEISSSVSLSELDMTAGDYLRNRNSYEKLINKIYTQVDPDEERNIQRFLNEFHNHTNTKPMNEEITFSVGENGEGGEEPEIVVQHTQVSSSYDYVQAMSDYFSNSGYKYSLVEDNLSGENTLLGNFLFETKNGHCALYATAMALALRYEGIPARFVTGYIVSGNPDSMSEDGKYNYLVLERDLHAWVEVYFPYIGWVAFDPTPAITEDVFDEAATASQTTVPTRQTTPSTETSETTAQDTPVSESDNLFTPEEGTTGFSLSREMVVAIMIVLVVAAITVLSVLFLRWLGRKHRRILAEYSNINSRKISSAVCDTIIFLLKMEGIEIRSGELPLEFAERVDEVMDLSTSVSMEQVSMVREKVEFSRHKLQKSENIVLSEYFYALYKQVILSQKPLTRLKRKIELVLVHKPYIG